jgi:uncharacterized RDD family membrane protein YckC
MTDATGGNPGGLDAASADRAEETAPLETPGVGPAGPADAGDAGGTDVPQESPRPPATLEPGSPEGSPPARVPWPEPWGVAGPWGMTGTWGVASQWGVVSQWGAAGPWPASGSWRPTAAGSPPTAAWRPPSPGPASGWGVAPGAALGWGVAPGWGPVPGAAPGWGATPGWGAAPGATPAPGWGAAPGPAPGSWSWLAPTAYLPPGPEPGLRWAGIGSRLGALILDAIVLAVSLFAVGLILSPLAGSSSSSQASSPAATAVILAWWLLVLGYHPACWYVFGATPGQKALGLRVARASDGDSLPIGAVLVRYLIFAVVTVLVPLGIISAVMARDDPYKRAWHDQVARSAVVRRR